MKIYNLSEQNSVFSNFLSEVRDVEVQKDSMRFRRNMERMGEIMAYEISKTLSYETKEVTTPLGISTCNVISDDVLLATVIRAGLPFHQGLLNFFDKARSCFISVYHKYGKDNKSSIQLDYAGIPNIEGKVLVLADPMLATGESMLLAYDKIIEKGNPSKVHLVSIVASKDGVENLSKVLPHKTTTFWCGAIDEELTNKAMIVPGLGNIGNLAYGDMK